ncbi:haloacid dehalogenase type II [Mesorhizobium muleiense]|uniref:haloacid dehalogenase type II n=1 Tax=Mesorhizobium muleiense TaxID=1004279 RepID=UPI003AFAD775
MVAPRHPSAHAGTGLLPAPRPLEYRNLICTAVIARKPDRIAEQIGKAVKKGNNEAGDEGKIVCGSRSRMLMALDGVRALVFDVFGTVVDWRSGVAREVEPFLKRHGAGSAIPAAFTDAWRRRYSPAMEEVRSGRRPFTRLDVLHRENLEAVLPEFGIDPALVPASELDELNLAWHRLEPWPDVVAGLARLRAHYIIAPLSNGNIALMLNMAKRSRIPWDAILGAEVVQAYKPAPEAYLRTADVLAMKPDEICLVAAHNGDLAAARACGLRTAFVPRPTEHGVAQATDLHPDQAWDLVASDFIDLAERLQL